LTRYNGSGPWLKTDLVRALPSNSYELRSSGAGMPTLRGHFAVWDTWAKIESAWEGTFCERLQAGCMSKTLTEQRDRIRVLFQHGRGGQIGDKVLGPITELREDEHGAYYEVQLLDTSYNRDLLPGLEAGLYGASFRFRVLREHVNNKPERSEYNPEGIPERTIRECHVHEFGPVTFGAYAEATAGVRSLTDKFNKPKYISAETALRRIALAERTF